MSAAARAAIREAVLVVGGARHLALAAPLIKGDRLPWPRPLSDAFPAILAHRGRKVAILASGDPYCYGIGGTLAGLVPVAERFCIPTPTAFSLACARLGWAAQDVATLSACGRPLAAIQPFLQPGCRILALSADGETPAALAKLLAQHGFGASVLHVMEALGGPKERIRSVVAGETLPTDITPLNLVGIEVVASRNARVIPRAAGLPDSFFEHDGQITKQEIRAVTLAALAPCAGELLWDIGCGSGSVAIEWSLGHSSNRAIGIERCPERAERAGRNARALGVPAVRIVTGAAPAALDGLPMPDAVFIGGGAQDAALIEAAWTALRNGGRLVVNAVTIETEMQLFGAQKMHGGMLTRLAVERLDRIGNRHGFRPAMSVTQWAAVKP